MKSQPHILTIGTDLILRYKVTPTVTSTVLFLFLRWPFRFLLSSPSGRSDSPRSIRGVTERSWRATERSWGHQGVSRVLEDHVCPNRRQSACRPQIQWPSFLRWTGSRVGRRQFTLMAAASSMKYVGVAPPRFTFARPLACRLSTERTTKNCWSNSACSFYDWHTAWSYLEHQ